MPFGLVTTWYHRTTADGVKEKYCGGCQEWLPHDTTHFGRNRTKRDGLQAWCKPCMRRICRQKSPEQWARIVRKQAERWTDTAGTVRRTVVDKDDEGA